MKLELKTENENYSNSLLHFLRAFFIFGFLIISFDASLKLGTISRHHYIYYHCSRLSVEKSTTNFKKLSRVSNLKSKQRIMEFCRTFIK